MKQSWVGVDVSKKYLDIVLEKDGRVIRVSNSLPGHRKLAKLVSEQEEQPRVVLEATGGYESAVHRFLHSQGIAVSLVNPRQVREFARASGQLAKTDKLDARILARFGQSLEPRITTPLCEPLRKLRALEDRRRQIVGMIRQEKCILEKASTLVRADVEQHILQLQKHVEKLEKQIDACITEDPQLCAQRKVLQIQQRVGPSVSATLLAHMPELGTLNRKQVAALAGVAPLSRDSGQMRGKRSCWAGRSQVRVALFMAALTAGKWNPHVKPLYDRLTAKGKAKKTVLIACARQLLVVLNATMREHLAQSSHETS